MDAQDLHVWLFRRTPIFAMAIDEHGRILDVSEALADRLGYRCEDLVGRQPAEIASPATQRLIESEYLPLLRRTGVLDNVPVEFETSEGDTVQFTSSTISERVGDGGAFRSVAIYSESDDVANLMRRVRNLYRSTPAMLHVVDANYRLLDVSDRWLRKLGYGRDEVIGRDVRDFLSDRTRTQLNKGRLKRLNDMRDHTNHPRQMVAKNGEIIEVLMSAKVNRDEKGEMRRMMVASKDVTAANKAEQQLREAFEENARLRRQLERERDYLREKIDISMNFGQIIGSSPALQRLLSRIQAVAETSASALIVGESGTGKELVAHAIHAGSARAGKALVKVNCASIPHELFESEFFGHKKGAFTGAYQDRVGRFKLADGGTLFLDEVGEIPLTLQGKMLRVLQEKEFEPIGDDHTVAVDVRVIAATNRDLRAEVDAGRFREDLYYRLSVFPLEVPALREREDDVVQIAAHFLDEIAKDFGRPPITLSQGQLDTLRGYDWPGNVRELRNVLERAVILSKGETIQLDLGHGESMSSANRRPANVTGGKGFLTETEFRERERANLIAALVHADWRVSGKGGAADLLGIKPTTLNGRMRAFGIERGQARRGRPRIPR